MRIVVAGGTGFLGRRICASLRERGHEIVVIGRSPAKAAAIPELRGLEARRGDVTEPRTLAGALRGAEAVVGAVQFPNHPMEVPRRGHTYDRYDRQGTYNLVDAARAAGASRFVYMSGAGADVTSDQPWYRAKGLAERAVSGSGMSFALVRPSWAYGPGDRALNRIALAARFSPFVPQLGAGTQRIQPVYVEDVACAVARIFEVERAWGMTFELGCSEVMTMREVIETLLEVMGRKRPIVPVPAPVAKLAAAPLVALPAPPMTPAGVDFATQDGLVDTAAARQVLGIEPLSFRDGISRYLVA